MDIHHNSTKLNTDRSIDSDSSEVRRGVLYKHHRLRFPSVRETHEHGMGRGGAGRRIPQRIHGWGTGCGVGTSNKVRVEREREGGGGERQTGEE